MSKPILAIDPGPVTSAYIELIDGAVDDCGIVCNDDMRAVLTGRRTKRHLAIEGIASYGMAVGAEVFQTCIWIGRFMEVFGPDETTLVYRKDVKMHLCHSMKAKDANIRQALIDRYGGKEKAIGRKKSPGPLYGVSSHCWAALSVAITFADRHTGTNQ